MENKESHLNKDHFGLYETDIQKITTVFTKFPEIEEVTIYGSRAKGNYKKYSDIDLCLTGGNLNKKILFKIELSLDDLMLPYQFDLNLEHRISNPDLLHQISKVGQKFYKR